MSITFSDEELLRRAPVWVALSDLFLDTDASLFDERIGAVLKNSRYEPDEIEKILREEVGPAFFRNLLDIAGEWAGWPDEWVRAEVLRHLERPLPLRAAAVALSAPVVSQIIKTDWPRVRRVTWGSL